MPHWSYALIYLVVLMAVALTADRLHSRSRHTPVPVVARRRPRTVDARRRES